MDNSLTKALSSSVNMNILMLLSLGKSFPREISRILMRDETDVSRRLRRLEEVGLVKGSWIRLGSRNVRVYELSVRELRIIFSKGKINVRMGSREFESSIAISNPKGPPKYSEPVGREEELELLANASEEIVHVWGPPGVGKTHLVAYHVLKEYGGVHPVFWYDAGEEDSLQVFRVKLGLFLSMLGYSGLLDVNPYSVTAREMASIVSEGLNRTRTILVVDDYHLLPKETSKLILNILFDDVKSRVYLLSRYRVKRLPYWAGKVLELPLGPLGKEASSRILGVSDEVVWRLTRGIPGILKIAARLIARGVPVEEAGERAARLYYEGLLPELVREAYHKQLLYMVALAGSSVKISAACEALGATPNKCQRAISGLRDAGLIDIVNDNIKVKEYLARILEYTPAAEVKAYAKRLARVLAESPGYEDRVKALEVMARACLVEEASIMVRDRLLNGSSVFICCPSLYARALSSLIECPARMRSRAYFIAELAIVETLNMRGNPLEASERLKEVLPVLGTDSPVFTRLLLLLSTIYLKMNDFARALETFTKASRLYNEMTGEFKEYLRETYLATAAYVYFYKGDLDQALKATLEEIDEALRKEDPGNYATALIHLAEIYRYRGEFERALNIVRRVLNNPLLFPSGPPWEIEALAGIPYCFSLIGIGRPCESVEVCRRLLSTSGGMFRTPLALALSTAYLLCGQLSEARRYFEESGMLEDCVKRGAGDPDCPLVHALYKALGGSSNTGRIASTSRVTPGIKVIINKINEI